MRTMIFITAILVSALAVSAVSATPLQHAWPSVDLQLKASRVQPGSALEKLILRIRTSACCGPTSRTTRSGAALAARLLAQEPSGGQLLGGRSDRRLSAGPQGDPRVDALPPGPRARPAPAVRTPRCRSFRTSDDRRAAHLRRPDRAAQRVGRSASTAGTRSRSSAPRTTSARSGQQAQFFSTNGGATWGQTLPAPAPATPSMSDPTVEWTSDGTAWSTTIGINSAQTALHMRAYKSTDGGATWTFDATFSGTLTNNDKEMHVGGPQRHLAVQGQHLRHLAHRPSGLGGAAHRPDRLLADADPGQRLGDHRHRDRRRHQDQRHRRRLRLLARHRQPASSTSSSRPTAASPSARRSGSPPPSAPSRSASRPTPAAELLIYISGGAYRTATQEQRLRRLGRPLRRLPAAPAAAGRAPTPPRPARAASGSRAPPTAAPPGRRRSRSTTSPALNDQFFPWLVVDDDQRQAGADLLRHGRRLDAQEDQRLLPVLDRRRRHLERAVQGDDRPDQRDHRRRRPAATSTATTTASTASPACSSPSWTDRRSGGHEEIWTVPITEP